MLFWLVFTALVCSSLIHPVHSVSCFYPQTFTTTGACTGSNSWTKWFNTAKPSDNGNLDQEFLTKIQAKNGHDVCARPQGMQAQSIGQLTSNSPVSCSWSLMNGFIAGFVSGTSGLDFQVRFCCPNTDFITTTTTSRPITSTTCGRAEIKHLIRAARIFGGSIAIPNSWPWQVWYKEKKPCGINKSCFGSCGGTLIDSHHVLTAAHCIGTTDPASITIIAGIHMKNASESHSRQERVVERIFIHPEYNPLPTPENDIAVLRFAQPVQFNRYIQPACLPGPDPKADADAILVGWGAINANGASYHQLKQAKVKVIPDCNKYWGEVDEEKQICVGHPVTGASACKGDSGGPMLYKHNRQWVVSGVASFVSFNECTTFANSQPNVYARVSFYMPWILSTLNAA